MKKTIRNIFAAAACAALAVPAFAGNPNRIGEAGAQQLLINPWARTAGWHSVNIASVRGIESVNLNPAGLIHTNRTDLHLSRTNWLQGSGVGINSFGLSQKLGGEEGANVITMAITSFSFGDIDQTTVNTPEISNSTYTLQMMNIAFGYAHRFSQAISAGVVGRIVSEGIPNARTQGFALDAGIQYRTGAYDRLKFGIALRNIGPTMSFSGDGLSTRGTIEGSSVSMTVENRSSAFELPSVLNMGFSYDILTATDTAPTPHRLTIAGSFNSFAFSRDQGIIGLEYGFREIVAVRGGFLYEANIMNEALSGNVYTGPSAGASTNVAFGKERTRILGIDYSYRATRRFGGVHSIGARLHL